MNNIIQVKGIWKGDRYVRLLHINKKIYQVKDTLNKELDNVYFMKEDIAIDKYNEKVEEVNNGTKI